MSILSHVHAQFTVYFCSCRFAFKIPPRKVYKRVRQLPEESESAVESSSTSVVVMNVKKLKDGTKKYHQKRNYCLFCDKCYPKLARHLEQRHADEAEVARALACPKRSKERRLQLDYLRKRGNRAHNVEALREGKGVVVPCKQSSGANADASDYHHCPNCQGLFKKKFMWKHMKRCALSQKCGKAKPGKTRVQSLCAFAQPVPAGVTTKTWKMISNMCQDKIAQAVKKDRCIIALAQQMLNKKGASQDEHIRATLRELGRLLLAGQEVTPLKSIEQYVMPSNVHNLIRAVKVVAGYDENTNTIKKSSLALKLGHSIKKVADLVACEALISGNQDKAKLIENFREIYRTRWNEFISASAYRTLQEAKWNAPQLIPFTDDVKKLHLHLDEKQEEYSNVLSGDQTPRNWTNLAKVILAKVILFNRRRQGEVSKMLLTTYLSRVSTPVHDDIAHALSEVEKILCKYFSRMEVRGKRGRKVPVLLTPAMVKSLDLLAKERSNCGILPDNDFLFARPGSASHLKGSDCIRVYARECGAEQPQTLSSTKLRKQVSTLSKVLNLTDTELHQLAEFLGHDIRIHRQYYRLPEGTLQLAKISKILMACEQGKLADFKGKTLEEITIEPRGKKCRV